MFSSLKSKVASLPLLEDKLVPVRRKLASALIGSTVDLLADSQTIAHGIVAGVRMVAGTPKIVVNGQLYDMDQVLTSLDPSIA
jgi:hypothetical protein